MDLKLISPNRLLLTLDKTATLSLHLSSVKGVNTLSGLFHKVVARSVLHVQLLVSETLACYPSIVHHSTKLFQALWGRYDLRGKRTVPGSNWFKFLKMPTSGDAKETTVKLGLAAHWQSQYLVRGRRSLRLAKNQQEANEMSQ